MTAVENLLTSPDTAGVWNLVPGRSTIAFQNKTFWGLVNVKGTFGEFSGDGQVTGKGAVFGRVDIRAASLNTGIRKRDRHLRSADFFDVEKYPEMSVVVTGAQPADGERAELRASLTVKGITRPIELPVTAGRRDDGTIAVSGRTTLNRSDFEVTGNMMGMMGATTMVSGDLVFRRVD